jgi:hypothetical protein
VLVVLARGGAFRLASVTPVTPAGNAQAILDVAASRKLKKRLACSFSWSAVSRKMSLICTRPSFLAWPAKYV